ncbi:MAPEG family protein [Gluconobacter sp. OJB]|uniref:MAPEG family protein n=1 Tax=Gluconobacter TaxID=441 RepID=UPI0038D1F5CC
MSCVSPNQTARDTHTFHSSQLGALLASHEGWQTEWGSHIYLAARIVYPPLYTAGIPMFRTFDFMISLLGLLLTA